MRQPSRLVTTRVERGILNLQMVNTAYVTGGKPIAIWSLSISGESAINPLVASYDIHERK
jgi:hypothetical protein